MKGGLRAWGVVDVSEGYLNQVSRFLWRWLTTTNHKDIGLLYIVTSIYFFLVAGALGMLVRAQLSKPGNTILVGNEYNEAVTMHGLFMLLWFVSPLAFGLANYIVPLQIGARDLAFPRLNALSYWLYLVTPSPHPKRPSLVLGLPERFVGFPLGRTHITLFSIPIPWGITFQLAGPACLGGNNPLGTEYPVSQLELTYFHSAGRGV